MSDNKQPSAVDQVGALDSAEAPVSQAERERDSALDSYSKDAQRSVPVRLRSPFKTYYDGQAFSVSAENATGPFDVLPGHHNFVCLLEPCDVIVRAPAVGEQKFTIGGGLMHVKADEIAIFLDI